MARVGTPTDRLRVGHRLGEVGHVIRAACAILADIYRFMAPDECFRYNVFVKCEGRPVFLYALYSINLFEECFPYAVDIDEILRKGHPKRVRLNFQFRVTIKDARECEPPV